jgi:VIT1/CCC1 family predicted Fe2+/Mn2+ transporter
VTGSNVAKFESRHRSVGGNALRAAVLGGNDGLVSNFSLVMEIAGVTAGGSAKGIPEGQAPDMAAEIMMDKNKAHEVLVKEELGINIEELKGSAREAAVYSFILFAVGAVIPVIPFMFIHGLTAIVISVIGSAIGLFLIGSAITLFTGKSILFSGFRQVIFGLIAAAITFAIGKLIGVSLAG